MKWQERIVEIREGSWSYVAGSIGVAPGMLLRSVCLDNDYNLSTYYKVDLYFLSYEIAFKFALRNILRASNAK